MSNHYGKIINFRAYDEELSILSNLGAKYNGSQSALIRQLIKHAYGMPIDNPVMPLADRKMINDLENIRGNLYRIGGNVNQIAHFISVNKIPVNQSLTTAINNQNGILKTMKSTIKNIERKLDINGD